MSTFLDMFYSITRLKFQIFTLQHKLEFVQSFIRKMKEFDLTVLTTSILRMSF